MSKPHLLYIAFFYPPSRASGVYRALATSAAFRDAGWDVTVITTTARFFEEEIGSTDDSLLDLIPRGVEVVRVPFSFRPTDAITDLRDMSWLQGNLPQLHRFLRTRTQTARTAIDIMRGRSPLSFPMRDRYLTWIEPIVKEASAINRRKKMSHILATGNPYSAFEAARVIGALTGAPFSIDYRDPWSFDLRTGGPSRLDEPTRQAEARIVDEAVLVVHVNQAIADAYKGLYEGDASKQIVVMNGYDNESVDVSSPGYAGGPLNFGMLGTVTDLWPLGPLFEAWSEIRSDLPEGSRLRMAGHLGYFAWSEEGILNSLPDEDSGFIFEGPLEKASVADFYGTLDVVVVPLFGGPMVTSGKIFEAAALGIPVVCIQDEGGGAREILSDHPYGFGVAADPAQIGDALSAAAKVAMMLTPDDIARTRKEMSRYERRRTMRKLVMAINEATPGATG